MAHPVVHFEIISKNEPKAREFYTNLFGWEINTESMPGYGLIAAPKEGQGIGGGLMATPCEEAGAYATFYVQVEDCAAHLQKAADLGAKVIFGPSEIPGIGTVGNFMDLDNIIIGVFQPAPGHG
jgi:predicted enzyme related to lactoylglutathione lyase